jgi:hypothetical protein
VRAYSPSQVTNVQRDTGDKSGKQSPGGEQAAEDDASNAPMKHSAENTEAFRGGMDAAGRLLGAPPKWKSPALASRPCQCGSYPPSLGCPQVHCREILQVYRSRLCQVALGLWFGLTPGSSSEVVHRLRTGRLPTWGRSHPAGRNIPQVSPRQVAVVVPAGKCPMGHNLAWWRPTGPQNDTNTFLGSPLRSLVG